MTVLPRGTCPSQEAIKVCLHKFLQPIRTSISIQLRLTSFSLFYWLGAPWFHSLLFLTGFLSTVILLVRFSFTLSLNHCHSLFTFLSNHEWYSLLEPFIVEHFSFLFSFSLSSLFFIPSSFPSKFQFKISRVTQATIM